MKMLLAHSLAIAGLTICAQAHSQNITFDSVPLTNSCAYPNVITMDPAPAVWVAPGDVKIVTKVVTGFRTPFGNYAAANNYQFNPGTPCTFSACTPASITLTCFRIVHSETTAKAVVVELKRAKNTDAEDKPAKN